MIRSTSSKRIKFLLLASAIAGSSACNSLSLAVPEPEPEPEHFTLVSELPSEFFATITAFYYPTQAEDCTRPIYDYGPGSAIPIPLHHFAIFDIARTPQPQQAILKIPLSYKQASCTLELKSVDFKIINQYGPDPVFDSFSSSGMLDIIEQRTESIPTYPANNNIELRRLCTVLFEANNKLPHHDGIIKNLFCHTTDEHWQTSKEFSGLSNFKETVVRSELSGKTIKVALRITPEEEPSRDNTWIKFPEGWKPCLPKEGWQLCQGPTLFKTFKMNGRECTVYPNCTE